MAQFAVRIYRSRNGFRALAEGWGAVEASTLAEATERARRLLLGVLGSAYPNRAGVEPNGACLVVWFEVELRESGRRAPSRGPRAYERSEEPGTIVSGSGRRTLSDPAP